TLAGRAGNPGTTDGTGANARFNRPWAVAVDASGNVFVADAANYTVRKVTPDGTVSTVAGQPTTSGTLDGPVAIAQFGTLIGAPSPVSPSIAGPFGLAADSTGRIYVADSFSYTIRQISAAGIVSTLAGAANASGFADGPGVIARFNVPWGIAIDS